MDMQNVALRFNAAINDRDLETLEALMTDDHAFIDTAGNADRGKPACVASWRGFFASFPDYRNVFARVTDRDDLVLITGYSTCSMAALDGPAIWTARIRNGKVAEWRVYDDSEANRQHLNIEQ